MARPDQLPLDVRKVLASQIGPQVASLLPPDDWQRKKVELSESFSVWLLPLNALAQPKNDLAALSIERGDWHHQIKVEGKALAFARSRPMGADPASWKVTEFYPANLAESIDQGIIWVDANVKEDWLVRLLVVPAFNLTSFWFVEGTSLVLIVHAPQYAASLPMKKLLDQAEFLDLLRKLPPIKGRVRELK
jgi:hypothetical protein